ncbi:hypothetical protein N0V88_007814 [Collariella sp. IMI 366227]|nr:hypothetical protein N0V88_007814 [Collariella sp. IMI 366227]
MPSSTSSRPTNQAQVVSFYDPAFDTLRGTILGVLTAINLDPRLCQPCEHTVLDNARLGFQRLIFIPSLASTLPSSYSFSSINFHAHLSTTNPSTSSTSSIRLVTTAAPTTTITAAESWFTTKFLTSLVNHEALIERILAPLSHPRDDAPTVRGRSVAEFVATTRMLMNRLLRWQREHLDFVGGLGQPVCATHGEQSKCFGQGFVPAGYPYAAVRGRDMEWFQEKVGWRYKSTSLRRGSVPELPFEASPEREEEPEDVAADAVVVLAQLEELQEAPRNFARKLKTVAERGERAGGKAWEVRYSCRETGGWDSLEGSLLMSLVPVVEETPFDDDVSVGVLGQRAIGVERPDPVVSEVKRCVEQR